MKAAYQLYTTIDDLYKSTYRLTCFQKPLFSLFWPGYLKNAVTNIYSLLFCSVKRGISWTGDAARGPQPCDSSFFLNTDLDVPAKALSPWPICSQVNPCSLLANRKQKVAAARHRPYFRTEIGEHACWRNSYFFIFFSSFVSSQFSLKCPGTYSVSTPSFLCSCSLKFDLFSV